MLGCALAAGCMYAFVTFFVRSWGRKFYGILILQIFTFFILEFQSFVRRRCCCHRQRSGSELMRSISSVTSEFYWVDNNIVVSIL
jgi:hypothetical protein